MTDEEYITLVRRAVGKAQLRRALYVADMNGVKLRTHQATKRRQAEEIVAACREIVRTVDAANPCPAVIFHGPGHQSRTHCEVKGPHTEHYAVLWGEHTGQYDWTGDLEVFAEYGGGTHPRVRS